jgi:hypothetical protein
MGEVGVVECIDTCQHRQQPANTEPNEMRALVPESLRQRMDAILGAEVVILIDPAAEIRVVVDQVVRAVCDEEAQCQDQPGDEGEWLSIGIQVLPGQ